MIKNTLDISHPFLAEQWHPEKNGKLLANYVTYGMRRKVWWLCKNTCSNGCKHEWEEQIRVRQKNGCPFCSKHRICLHDSIEYTHPEIAKQWHPTKNGNLLPSQVTHGTLKKVWWLCNNISCQEKCPHEWEATIGSRCGKESCGCPFCVTDGLRKVCIHNSIVYTHPEIAKQWHPSMNGDKKPEEYSYGCKLKFWWRCNKTCEKGCVHDFEARVFHRVKKSMGCPYCCKAVRKVCQHTCLQETHPEIAKQWHPSKNGSKTPLTISRGHSKKVWWVCENKHEYNAIVSNRTVCNQGCPICVNKSEKKLYEILSEKYKIVRQFKLESCKDKSYLPFDFCIPELKIIIELDGNQHFKQVMNWKSPEENFKRDIFKMEKALVEGYTIIRIYQPIIYNLTNDIIRKICLENINNLHNIKYITPYKDIYNNFYTYLLEYTNLIIEF